MKFVIRILNCLIVRPLVNLTLMYSRTIFVSPFNSNGTFCKNATTRVISPIREYLTNLIYCTCICTDAINIKRYGFHWYDFIDILFIIFIAITITASINTKHIISEVASMKSLLKINIFSDVMNGKAIDCDDQSIVTLQRMMKLNYDKISQFYRDNDVPRWLHKRIENDASLFMEGSIDAVKDFLKEGDTSCS